MPSPANPTDDDAILAGLSFGPPTDFGNGMFVVDASGTRRVAFPDAQLADEAL